MSQPASNRTVLIVDDDGDALALTERVLEHAGFDVRTALGGAAGIEAFDTERPALVLLDVEMPGVNGYAVAEYIRSASGPGTPVVFLTAHGEAARREQALAVGAVAYLTKPVGRDDLIKTVGDHIDDAERWRLLREGSVPLYQAITPDDFRRFAETLVGRAGLEGEEAAALLAVAPDGLYDAAEAAGIADIDVAELLADALDLEVVSALDPVSVDMEALPAAFGEKNRVARLTTEDGSVVFAVANPFLWELLDVLERHRPPEGSLRLMITTPESVEALFRQHKGRADAEAEGDELGGGSITLPSGRASLKSRTAGSGEDQFAVTLRNVREQPVVLIANSLILETMREGASDIHLEPKENEMHIRFRVHGDMRDVLTLSPQTGVKLVSRLKALAGLDIAERRKPQDGALEVNAGSRRLKLRLATSSGPFGESMVIRVLDSSAAAQELRDLGMTDEQATELYGFADRPQGLILIVGPTGSGKTTTIYSVLTSVDTERRSLMSVEDPVEYLIPRANQQQVDEKGGVTFDALLKSSVRQDPDILFLGEVRDSFSARTAVDFASTGHLTITTLHTSDATNAIFRLERLGVERPMMAEALLCVVAQRLVKRLCPECRDVRPITDEEREILAVFTDDAPEQVADPVGCPACNTGYAGRVAICEIVGIDERMATWLREGAPVKEIRIRLWLDGTYLMHRSVLDKVRALEVSVADANAKVLVEESGLARDVRARQAGQAPTPAPADATAPAATPTPATDADAGAAAIGTAAAEEQMIGAAEVERGHEGEPLIGGVKRLLVVEDDESTRLLLAKVLGDAGYHVTAVGDGVEALPLVRGAHFDLVLTDVNMPEIDGLSLIGKMVQEGIETPVLMLTGSTEGADEVRALELGVLDFVHKPVRRDVLLLRVERALKD